ncbi:MAG: hypothetical protein K8R54_04505 [Bacteroidales bacterium]|nr:hypothetical protein [Bacteroidales bacterium]
MKKIYKIFPILILAILFSACDLYPDWEEYVEYSSTYPVSGEYYVYDYEENGDRLLIEDGGDPFDAYSLYIYNKSYNPTKDSIWVDNRTGHPTGGGSVEYPFKYKIKCKADTVNLSFNCERQGTVTGLSVNPLDSAITVTITESKIFDYDPGDITSAVPDSIYFKFSYYDKYGDIVKTIVTAGHRKSGWEEPQNDDNM